MKLPAIPHEGTIFTQPYTIRTSDMEGSWKTSPVALCGMFLDAAGKHAHEMGVSVASLRETDRTWVLSRLAMTIERYPRVWETVTIHTWPSGMSKVYAYRHFVIVDSAGDPLAGGSTSWLVIDAEKRRPVRVDRVFRDRGLSFPEGEPDGIPLKLGLPEEVTHEKRFVVRHSDIDMNDHVTSTSYLGWALESVPDKVRAQAELSELTVNFLTETLYGDTVVSSAGPDAQKGAFLHLIANAEDGREHARIRSEWRECED